MRIYKFKDEVDGKFAFIAAQDENKAADTLLGLTSLPFKLVESKSLEEIERSIVLLNTMLPF